MIRLLPSLPPRTTIIKRARAISITEKARVIMQVKSLAECKSLHSWTPSDNEEGIIRAFSCINHIHRSCKSADKKPLHASLSKPNRFVATARKKALWAIIRFRWEIYVVFRHWAKYAEEKRRRWMTELKFNMFIIGMELTKLLITLIIHCLLLVDSDSCFMGLAN